MNEDVARWIEYGRRVDLIDASVENTPWVTCGDGRTEDSMVTPSARAVVRWIRGETP